MNTNLTLRHILRDKGHAYIKMFGLKMRRIEILAILKVLQCGTEKNGVRTFFCPECGRMKLFFFTCKNRLCSRCGKKANDKCVQSFVNCMAPYTHRLITWGMPSKLWKIFHERPEAKKKLMKAPYDCIRQLMSDYHGKTVTPGSMNTLHTYGRDLKVNNHVHTITSEGGYDDEGNWLKYTFLPFVRKGKVHKTINEVWRDAVLEILRLELPRTKNNARFLEGFRRSYPKGFYVYSPKECRIKTGMKAKNKAKYITRYVRHPPISDRRLESYDGEIVTFWYEHPTTKIRHTVTLEVIKFIRLVLIHLPDKGFKMVQYYGLYSPKYRNKLSYQTMFNEKGVVINPKNISWRQMRIVDTGSDPLECEECGREMTMVSMVFRRDDDYCVRFFVSVEDRWAMDYNGEENWIVERNRRKSRLEMIAEPYLAKHRSLDLYVN